jgi:hypothetical protein
MKSITQILKESLDDPYSYDSSLGTTVGDPKPKQITSFSSPDPSKFGGKIDPTPPLTQSQKLSQELGSTSPPTKTGDFIQSTKDNWNNFNRDYPNAWKYAGAGAAAAGLGYLTYKKIKQDRQMKKV